MSESITSDLTLEKAALINSVLTKDELDERESAKDIEYFWVYLKKLIEFLLDTKINDVSVLGAFPSGGNQLELPCEVITRSIISRLPAQNDRTTKAYKPMIINDNATDPLNPDYKLTIWMLPLENRVKVSVWAKTIAEADERAKWLENIFFDYSWFFRYMGIDNLIWEGQGPDEEKYPTDGGQLYYGRPIHLLVLTKKVWEEQVKVLETVRLYTEKNSI